jgi:hypothetical protein
MRPQGALLSRLNDDRNPLRADLKAIYPGRVSSRRALIGSRHTTPPAAPLLRTACDYEAGRCVLIPLDVAHHSGMISPTIPI